MTELGRKSHYVNLSGPGKKNIAQIHPQKDGVGLVSNGAAPANPRPTCRSYRSRRSPATLAGMHSGSMARARYIREQRPGHRLPHSGYRR